MHACITNANFLTKETQHCRQIFNKFNIWNEETIERNCQLILFLTKKNLTNKQTYVQLPYVQYIHQLHLEMDRQHKTDIEPAQAWRR